MGEQGQVDTIQAPDGPGSWRFDKGVADQFDEHFANSIPNYADLRRFVTEAAGWQIDRFANASQSPHVVDLGASRGGALQPIVDRYGARARYTAVEIADPMRELLTERFDGYINAGIFKVRDDDLREGYPSEIGMAHVVISVMTLMFVPIEHRQRLLMGIARQLHSGGILIIAEKVLPAGGELDQLMNETHLKGKVDRGYAEEEVRRKALSLEGVLVPLTARFNEELILQNGFSVIDVCWAYGPFRGWVAVKR